MSRTRTSTAIEALAGTALALACAIAVWFAGAGTASSIPVGFLCTTVANVGRNYSLIKVIQGSGAYRRCV